MIRLKNEKDLEGLRASGKILAFVLGRLKGEARVGLRLDFLDGLARELFKEAGAKPAFLGYKSEGAKTPYPAAICTSVNATIVHGLPGDYKLKEGDILKIDLGVEYNGYVTDAAVTVGIGQVSEAAKRLIKTTKEALAKAVDEFKEGNHLSDIGWVIETTVKKNGFNIIKSLTGHGVGFELHEDPVVYNYGNRGEGMKLQKGLVLAIEPMVSIDGADVKQMPDGSFITRDNSLTAHFEHTVALTQNGPEILTSLKTNENIF